MYCEWGRVEEDEGGEYGEYETGGGDGVEGVGAGCYEIARCDEGGDDGPAGVLGAHGSKFGNEKGV